MASNPTVQTDRSTSSKTPLTQKLEQKVRVCRPMFGRKCEKSSPTPKLTGPSSNGNQ